MTKCYSLTLVLNLTLVAGAAASASTENRDSTKTAPPETKKQTIHTPATDENTPKPIGAIKNRDLGTAFEAFIPTETISADKAVPFPVDI